MAKKQNPDLDRFGIIIRGFIRSNPEKKTGRLIDTKPDRWLAIQMGMTENTVKNYLANPLLLSAGAKAIMKDVLQEKLVTGNSVDAMTILIDSIPERKK